MANRNNISDMLEQLEQIETVDPNPFLYTRIKASIAKDNASFSPVVKRLIQVGFALVIGINLFVLIQASRPQNHPAKSLSGAMQLMPHNQLYGRGGDQ